MKTKLILIFTILFCITANAQKWTNFLASDGLASDYVYSISIDKESIMWFGTSGGVSKYDGTSWTNYTISNSGLATDRVEAIVIDLEGNKWFGTWGGGVSKFDGTHWTTYLPYDIVTCIAMDNNGILWFGTGQGITKYDGTNWVSYTTANLSSSLIRSIAIEENGIIWVGSEYGGLWKFDGTNWTNYTKSNSGLVHDWVRSIAIDDKGNKWFVTGGGLSKFDDINWTSYILYGMFAISIDSEGNIWLPRSGVEGVLKFDLNNWTTYNCPTGIYGEFLCIAIDAEGNKWFGNYGSGVLKFEDATLDLSTYTINLSSDNNSHSNFEINSNSEWNATSNETWLTLSDASGSGNSTITLTATENPTTAPRTATITVSVTGVTDQIITVTQDGAIPVLNVSTNEMVIGAIDISTQTLDIISNVAWSATSNQTWLTISNASGSGNFTITLTATGNPATATRTANVTISGTGVTDQIIIVTQEAGATEITDISSNSVLMFPNPVSNELTINGININATISIFDSNGKLLINRIAKSASMKINLSSLANGVYTIIVIDKKVTISSKFIKQ